MDLVVIIAVLSVVIVLVAGGLLVNSQRHHGVVLEQPPPDIGEFLTDELTQNDAPGELLDTAVAEPTTKPSFRNRLSKARATVSGYVGAVLSRTQIDAASWDALEEGLIRADVGVTTTASLLDELRAQVKSGQVTTSAQLIEALKGQLVAMLDDGDRTLHFEANATNVWLFVGVNGVGKTTTIGKLAKQQHNQGRSVVLAAGDTFRAAAADQLAMWAERTDSEIVRGQEGGDPASVIFNAVEKAAARNINLVLADTAGRLHNKSNLMQELDKVVRVASREPGKLTEVLMVLDATTGQNGVAQAKEFTSVAGVTGVVLTKLDGSAKGGVAVAIHAELGIPIKLVGLGEGVDDLVAFDPKQYVDALFD